MLSAGLGRAVLHLQQHDPIPLRPIILNACLHNITLDPQGEGTRAQYLLDVLDATNEIEFYRPQILQALESLTESADEYDVDQLYDLAKAFAQRGDAQARTVVYDKFDAMPGLGGFSGANVIVDLDGLSGFMRVAKRLRIHLLTLGDAFVVGDNTYFLDEELVKALRARTWKAKSRPLFEQEPHIGWHIIGIVEKTDNTGRNSGSKLPDFTSASYNEIKPLIDDLTWRNRGSFWWKWGKQASDSDILAVAADLLAETDPKRLVFYLHIFRKRAFPLDPAKLVMLAKNGHDPLEVRGDKANDADRLA